jgi:hypothetical protein
MSARKNATHTHTQISLQPQPYMLPESVRDPILLGHDLLLLVGVVMVPIPDDTLHHIVDNRLRLLLLLRLIPMRKRNHVIIHEHIRRTFDLGLERELDPRARRQETRRQLSFRGCWHVALVYAVEVAFARETLFAERGLKGARGFGSDVARFECREIASSHEHEAPMLRRGGDIR